MKRSVFLLVIVNAILILSLAAGGCGGDGRSPSWAHPQDITDSISFPGTSVGLAQVAMNARGDAILVWDQLDIDFSGHIYLAERDGYTGKWTWPADPGEDISPEGTSAQYARLAMDDRGNAVVAWWQSDGGAGRVFVSERDGATGAWTHPADLNDHIGPFVSGNFTASPVVAMGANGDAIVAWSMGGFGTSAYVFMSERTGPAGPWSAPVNLYVAVPGAATDTPGAASVGMDDNGNAVLAWSQIQDSFLPSVASQVYISERDGSTGAWTHPADAGDSIAPAGTRMSEARVAMGAAGHAVLAWYQSDGSHVQIFISERDGATGGWTHPSDSNDNISPDGSQARFHRVAVNGRGDAVVVWRQIDTAGHDQIFMSTRNGDTGAWSHPADRDDNISPDGTSALERDVAMDDRGYALVAWHQGTGSGSGVYISERAGPNAVWTHPAGLGSHINPDVTAATRPPYTAVGGEGSAIVVWRQVVGGVDQLYMSEKW